MTDDSKHTNELPTQLLDLVQSIAARTRKALNRSIVSLVLQACVVTGVGMILPTVLEMYVALGISAILLLWALFIATGNSLGSLSDFPDVLRRGDVKWVAQLPGRHGFINLLFFAEPTVRWHLRATPSEVSEIFGLLSRYASSIHVEPYDQKLYRQWRRDPSVLPWV